MADNVAITAGSGTTIAADDIAGVLHQRVKLSLGADGTAADAPVGAGTATGVLRTTLASDDPAVATLGATTGAAVITDANGTIQQYLRGLIKQWIAGTLKLATTGYAASVTFTSGTSAFAANDVVGVGGGNAALTFSNAGVGAGEHLITSVSLLINRTALISGETSYVLHLYSVTPPSALADSAAFDLSSGDQASYLGAIAIGTPVDLGSTLYVRQDGVNVQLTLASSSLFGYLVSVGPYTPTAVSHTIVLHTVAL